MSGSETRYVQTFALRPQLHSPYAKEDPVVPDYQQSSTCASVASRTLPHALGQRPKADLPSFTYEAGWQMNESPGSQPRPQGRCDP